MTGKVLFIVLFQVLETTLRITTVSRTTQINFFFILIFYVLIFKTLCMDAFFNLEKDDLRNPIEFSLGTTFAEVKKTKD